MSMRTFLSEPPWARQELNPSRLMPFGSGFKPTQEITLCHHADKLAVVDHGKAAQIVPQH
jgi:hypothetical protein